RDVLLVQMKQREKLDEIALDKAHAAQVVEFAVGEAQLAKLSHLAANLVDIRHEIDIRRAAMKPVLDAGHRKMMQYHLHHRELVQIGIEQRGDDHDVTGRTADKRRLLWSVYSNVKRRM